MKVTWLIDNIVLDKTLSILFYIWTAVFKDKHLKAT